VARTVGRRRNSWIGMNSWNGTRCEPLGLICRRKPSKGIRSSRDVCRLPRERRHPQRQSVDTLHARSCSPPGRHPFRPRNAGFPPFTLNPDVTDVRALFARLEIRYYLHLATRHTLDADDRRNPGGELLKQKLAGDKDGGRDGEALLRGQIERPVQSCSKPCRSGEGQQKQNYTLPKRHGSTVSSIRRLTKTIRRRRTR